MLASTMSITAQMYRTTEFPMFRQRGTMTAVGTSGRPEVTGTVAEVVVEEAAVEVEGVAVAVMA